MTNPSTCHDVTIAPLLHVQSHHDGKGLPTSKPSFKRNYKWQGNKGAKHGYLQPTPSDANSFIQTSKFFKLQVRRGLAITQGFLPSLNKMQSSKEQRRGQTHNQNTEHNYIF